MNVNLSTAELARALYRVQGIVDKNTSMPNLAYVLLEAKAPNQLVVTATDLDVRLSGTYEATVHTPGATVVHAKQFYGILKSIAGATLSLETQDNHSIVITSDSSRFCLVGLDASEFPSQDIYSTHDPLRIPVSVLTKMLDRTLFCVSTDESRHNLTGVYCVSNEKGVLRFVATDGHRLAMADAQFEQAILLPEGVIIPKKPLHELKRILNDPELEKEVLTLSFSDSGGLFQVGNITLSTGLIDGAFPNYERVIPKNNEKTVALSVQELSEALRRVSLLSQGRSYGVRLSFGKDQLVLQAENPEFGSATETLSIFYPYEALSIGFNARYLLDVLSHCHAKSMNMQLVDDLSPAVLVPDGDRDYLAVVMPVRI